MPFGAKNKKEHSQNYDLSILMKWAMQKNNKQK